MAERVRVAVVGSGYFGRFHADHYARNDRAELVAIVDTDAERARAVAGEFGGEPVSDFGSIIGKVDAASVAVPTPQHYDVARALLQDISIAMGATTSRDQPPSQTAPIVTMAERISDSQSTRRAASAATDVHDR